MRRGTSINNVLTRSLSAEAAAKAEGGGEEGVSWEERTNVVLGHARLHVAQYGERGIVTFRKHLAWYFKGNKIAPHCGAGLKELRMKLMKVNTLQELEDILANPLPFPTSSLRDPCLLPTA